MRSVMCDDAMCGDVAMLYSLIIARDTRDCKKNCDVRNAMCDLRFATCGDAICEVQQDDTTQFLNLQTLKFLHPQIAAIKQ
jgi:hypothetical protein